MNPSTRDRQTSWEGVRPSVSAYGVSLAAVAVAVAVRLMLDPLLADRVPFVTMFAAVIFVARYCGRGPALLSVAGGSVAVAFFLLEPRHSFAVSQIEYQVGLVLFVLIGLGITAAFDSLKKAKQRVEEKRKQLESEVAARQVAEKILAGREELLRITLASIGDAVITTDASGNVTSLNSVAQHLTGWSQDDASGKSLMTVFRIINEQTRKPVENPVEKALKSGQVVGLANHTILVRKDGVEWHIDDSAAPIRDEGGGVVGVVLVFRDISQRRRLELEAADRLAVTRTLASIVESSDDAIIGHTLDGVIQSWNAAAERLFDFPAKEAVGRSISLIIPPDRAHEAERIVWCLRAGERVEHFETVRVRKDGQHLQISLSVSPIRDEDGKVVGASKIARDVTERKRVEDALVRSERELKDFFDNAVVGLHWVGPDGIILRANKADSDLLGYGREEYVGRQITEFHADQTVISDILRRLQAREPVRNYPARLLCKDGSIKDVLIDSSAMWENGRFVHSRCFTRDISQQKVAERALLENRKRLAAELAGMTRLHELISRLLVCTDLHAALEEVLDATIAITDTDVGYVQLFDPRSDTLAIVVERGWKESVLDDLRTIKVDADTACSRAVRSGERVIINDVQAEVAYEPYRQVAASAGYRAVQSTPMVARSGVPLGVLTTFYGQSHRLSDRDRRILDLYTRQAVEFIERSRTETALRQTAADLSDASRRKDEFLATLAHELRNPLAPIRNGLEVMRLSGGGGESFQRARGVMERQLEQMVRLIDDLLDISRISQGKLGLRKERANLAVVVDNAVETSRPVIASRGHELTLTLPPEPVFVDADVTRMAQVFANLLNNSAKYSDRGGHIWLTAVREGNGVVVSVKDTGVGIPPDMLPKVFDLFTQVDRSLEKSQGGLGIGLTLVKRLVDMHGGSVEARSEGHGKGSEFIVRLPIVLAAVKEVKPLAAAGESPRPADQFRILVADDNLDSAASLAMMLTLMGNDVRTANDGSEAVDVAAAFEPQVILLDIGIPKLNGYEACRRIREQPWGRKATIIALTGWGQDDDRRQSREAGFDHHMVKPVDPAALEKLLAGLQPATV